MAVVTDADIAALRAIVGQELKDLTGAVVACLTTLDKPTTDAWNKQAAILIQWISTGYGPVGSGLPTPVDYYDQGKALEGVVRDNWYPRLAAAGCTVPAPPGAVPPLRHSTQNPLSELGILANLAELAPFVIAYLVLRELKF